MVHESFDIHMVLRLLDKNDFGGLRELIKGSHPVDLAEIFEELSSDEAVKLFELFDFETSIEVFEEMESPQKLYILDHIDPGEAAQIVGEMPTDVLAEFVRDLSEEDKNIVFSLMEKQDERDLKGLLTYREDTAGGLMTTEYWRSR